MNNSSSVVTGCYLESNSETYLLSNNFFGNPKEFACFIPSMVQNNMLSTNAIESKGMK